MQEIFSGVFTPLSVNYCDFFYYLTVLSVLSLLYVIVSGIVLLFTRVEKGKHLVFLGNLVFSLLPLGLMYFQNRLLFSMCRSSLQ